MTYLNGLCKYLKTTHYYWTGTYTLLCWNIIHYTKIDWTVSANENNNKKEHNAQLRCRCQCKCKCKCNKNNFVMEHIFFRHTLINDYTKRVLSSRKQKKENTNKLLFTVSMLLSHTRFQFPVCALCKASSSEHWACELHIHRTNWMNNIISFYYLNGDAFIHVPCFARNRQLKRGLMLINGFEP